jgi:phage shock protein E
MIDFKNATIIDVRTPGEFAMGNVDGSINIPLNTIPEHIEELKKYDQIVLCCASGGRSNTAYQYLQQQGFTNIADGGPWNMVALQVMN